jgi:cathepsin B
MKLAIFALLVVAVLSNQRIIDEVNSGNNNWKAGYNAGYSDLSTEEARSLLRTRFVESPVRTEILSSVSLPDSFDSRDKWGNCIGAIRDQGQCGSCWAFGASESFTDRYCISKGSFVLMSPQYIVSCDSSNYGCNGGYLNLAMEFLVNTGTVEDTCDPYFSGNNGDSGTCPTQCKDGSPIKTYKGASYKHISNDENSIMTEIYNNGPVEVAFTVYEDFMSYKSGVYKHVSGGMLGGHAVKNIGWGVSNGEKYWIIANSWNTTWGNQGFFWILKGADECGIEDQVFAIAF